RAAAPRCAPGGGGGSRPRRGRPAASPRATGQGAARAQVPGAHTKVPGTVDATQCPTTAGYKPLSLHAFASQSDSTATSEATSVPQGPTTTTPGWQQKEVGGKVAGGPHGPAVTNGKPPPRGQRAPPAGGALHWKRVPPKDAQAARAEKPVALKEPEHTPLASERSQHIGPSLTTQDAQKGPPSHASP